MRQFIKNWWPSALTLLVVLWATLAKDPTGDVSVPMFEGADKIVHFIMFGGLTGAFIFDRHRALWHSGRKPSAPFITVLVIAMTAFAFADEWAQDAMHLGRTADAADLLADAAGILTGAITAPPVVARVLRRYHRRHPSSPPRNH